MPRTAAGQLNLRPTCSLFFVFSVVSEGDLHKRLLFTMWNSDSTTRYLLGFRYSMVTVWHMITLTRERKMKKS